MTQEVLPGATYVGDGLSFVDDLKALDQHAWGQVYDQHFQPLFLYALSRVGDRSEAEEQAAQVLEEAVRGIGRYQERGVPFRAWLFRIARNVVSDHIRRRQREWRLTVINPGQASFESGISFQLSFQGALRQLSEEQRQVVVLRFVNDLSLKECAQAMGKSLSAVKSLQTRGFERLREYFEDERGAD